MKIKSIVALCLSLVFGAGIFAGLNEVTDAATDTHAASTKRIYVDPNGLAGFNWTNFRAYYFNGSGVTAPSWPGTKSTSTNKINANTTIFTGGRSKLNRTVYYFDIPTNAQKIIFCNANTSTGEVWNRWNNFDATSYNFFQITGWGVGSGDQNTVSNYNSYKLHNVTLNYANGSVSTEHIVSSWGQYQAPSSNWYTNSTFTTTYTTKTLTSDITLYEKPTATFSINNGTAQNLTYDSTKGEFYKEGLTLKKGDTIKFSKNGTQTTFTASLNIHSNFNNLKLDGTTYVVANDATNAGVYFKEVGTKIELWVSGHTFDGAEIAYLYVGIGSNDGKWANGVYLYSWGSSGTNETHPNGDYPGQKLTIGTEGLEFKENMGLIRVPIYSEYTTHFKLTNGFYDDNPSYFGTNNFVFKEANAYFEVSDAVDSYGDVVTYGPAANFVYDFNEERVAVAQNGNILSKSICGLDAKKWLDKYDALSKEVKTVVDEVIINTYDKNIPTNEAKIKMLEIISQLRENYLNSVSDPLKLMNLSADTNYTTLLFAVLFVGVTTIVVLAKVRSKRKETNI